MCLFTHFITTKKLMVITACSIMAGDQTLKAEPMRKAMTSGPTQIAAREHPGLIQWKKLAAVWALEKKEKKEALEQKKRENLALEQDNLALYMGSLL